MEIKASFFLDSTLITQQHSTHFTSPAEDKNPRTNCFDSHGDVTESCAKPPPTILGIHTEEWTTSHRLRHYFPNLGFWFFEN